jgi:hypothetical protein
VGGFFGGWFGGSSRARSDEIELCKRCDADHSAIESSMLSALIALLRTPEAGDDVGARCSR